MSTLQISLAVIGAAATQPAKADYTGGRGKKTWIVSSTVTTGGEVVAAGATVYMPVAPSAESSTTSSANRTRARVAGTYRTPKIRIVANAATSASTAVLQEDGQGRCRAIRAGEAGQADIDGGLIGGASLKASDFVAIARAAA